MALRFPMEQQQQTEWCWDAVTVSVERYFKPGSKLTQKNFAKKIFGQPLNQGWYLDKALEAIQKLDRVIGQPLTFQEVRAQLDQNLPVCVRIAWDTGGFHCVVISGYDTSGGIPRVHVSDPKVQDSNVEIWDYESFLSTYDPRYAQIEAAEGVWDETYVVKP